MTENPDREPDTTDANPADLPYKDDTSDGTTAKTPQQIAEDTADQVRSSDQVARAEAGIPDPEEGHDVREHRPEILDTSASQVPENPGYAGDLPGDKAADEE